MSCRVVANFSPNLIAQSKDDLPLGELIYTYIVRSSDMEKRKLRSSFRKTKIGRANQVESLGGNWRKNELRDKNWKKIFSSRNDRRHDGASNIVTTQKLCYVSSVVEINREISPFQVPLAKHFLNAYESARLIRSN